MLQGSNPILEEYFNILSKDIPEFLHEYVSVPEMQRLTKVSQNCGTDFTNIFNHKFYHSILDHSIGVALIVWNFTKDKNQTISALFHDISTPVFKHCIDFMNGDYERQESTEELTKEVIINSREIIDLLNRDNIKIEDIYDYHIYPIADNDTPRLSADRLEYNFSNGLCFDSKDILNVQIIKKIYDNLEILVNEDGIQELGFKDKKIAEEFIHYVKDIWPFWISSKDKVSMQFLADIVKRMSEKGYITKRDLYVLSEREVVSKIENCEDETIRNAFIRFKNQKTVYESDERVPNKYCVSVKAKKRYIIPLVKTQSGAKRIIEISDQAKEDINQYLKTKTAKWAYLDFEF